MVQKRLDLFERWFHKQFVPQVFIQTANKESKTILFYDNYSAHPQEIVSYCGNIICRCLSPNTTGAIQPMDQGPIKRIKDSYKMKATNKALRQMDKNTAVGNMFNKFTIKDVIDIVSNSSADCHESLITKSRHQLGLCLEIKYDLFDSNSATLKANLIAVGLSEQVKTWLISND